MPADVRGRLLEAIENENLTWEHRYGLTAPTRTIYKLWSSETEYRTLTPTERKHLKALLDEDIVTQYHGWRHTAGSFQIKRYPDAHPTPSPEKGDAR